MIPEFAKFREVLAREATKTQPIKRLAEEVIRFEKLPLF
jgi:hypothetical protein